MQNTTVQSLSQNPGLAHKPVKKIPKKLQESPDANGLI
jgi:hypothetical protein